VRHPFRSLSLLFRHPRWLLGFAVGLGGWVLYVAALRLAPLSLVQAASAGGVGVLALLVVRVRGIPLARREAASVASAMLGLGLLAVSLAGHSSAGRHGSSAAVGAWVGASLVLAGLAAGGFGLRLAPGAGLGVAAGVLYASGDVATKAAVAGGTAFAFVAAVLACHGLAFVALQLGFQRGGPFATIGVATLLTNALPILAGTTLFREGLPSGGLGVVRVLAFLAVVAGAAGLARAEGGPDATGPRRMAESSERPDDRRMDRFEALGEAEPDGRSRQQSPPSGTPAARMAGAAD
jgi:hypothetical protein